MKKIHYEENAEIKTVSDYALILQYCNGYSVNDSRKFALESQSEPLFMKLLERNTELFKTGNVVII